MMNYFNSEITLKDNGTIEVLLKKDISIDKFIEYLSTKTNCDLSKLGDYLYHDNGILKEFFSFKIYISNQELFIEQYGLGDYIVLISIRDYKYESIKIDKENELYEYCNDNQKYCSLDINAEDKEKIYPKVTSLIKLVDEYFERVNIALNASFLFNYINLYNDDIMKKIYGNNEIFFSLLKYYDESFNWMKLDIVDTKTYEIVGFIEIKLKGKDDDNFNYVGNIAYGIKERYRNKGYATKALALIKEYVSKYADEYNKVLYISTLADNYYSQQVAIANDGVLYYEGDVPKGDKLNSIGKVTYVKIYRIDNL